MTIKSIRNLSRVLLRIHGLHDWEIKINNVSSYIGMCNSEKKEIYFSKQYADVDASEIIDTILHEIAHALVGVEHDHDEIWQEAAYLIGCSGRLEIQ